MKRIVAGLCIVTLLAVLCAWQLRCRDTFTRLAQTNEPAIAPLRALDEVEPPRARRATNSLSVLAEGHTTAPNAAEQQVIKEELKAWERK